MGTVPGGCLARRLDNLRVEMQTKGLDAVLVNHPANRYYIGGVYAADIQLGESAGWLLVGQTQAYGLFSSAHYEEWREQAPHLECMVVEAPSARKYGGRAAELIIGNGWTRVGVDEDALSLQWYIEVMSGLQGRSDLFPMRGLIESLRNYKDEWEIACVKNASAITTQAYEYVMGSVGPGITERELAWEMEKAMRERGAMGLGFPTIVGAGKWAAVPHHVPIDEKILEGQSVVVDMGAMVHGYASDMTRTFCFGRAPERLRKIHADVKVALDKEVRVAVVGAIPRGHGVGITVHEDLSLPGDGVLKPNCVIALEPGVYIPGWGGVRLEDTVLVTQGAPVRLTTATMALEFH